MVLRKTLMYTDILVITQNLPAGGAAITQVYLYVHLQGVNAAQN